MFFNKLIATFFGIGYIGRGAGSIAALATCIILLLLAKLPIQTNTTLISFCSVSLIAGVYCAGKVEVLWGKDSQTVVIDEVLGMTISLLFLPINLFTVAVAFILFRFFDIAKPLFIRKAEKLKGGWGVMLDDVIAGIYTNMLMQGITFLITNHYEDIF